MPISFPRACFFLDSFLFFLSDAFGYVNSSPKNALIVRTISERKLNIFSCSLKNTSNRPLRNFYTLINFLADLFIIKRFWIFEKYRGKKTKTSYIIIITDRLLKICISLLFFFLFEVNTLSYVSDDYIHFKFVFFFYALNRKGFSWNISWKIMVLIIIFVPNSK